MAQIDVMDKIFCSEYQHLQLNIALMDSKECRERKRREQEKKFKKREKVGLFYV